MTGMEETMTLEQVRARNLARRDIRREHPEWPESKGIASAFDAAIADVDFLLSQLTTIQSERDELRQRCSDMEAEECEFCETEINKAEESFSVCGPCYTKATVRLLSERDELDKLNDELHDKGLALLAERDEALREVERLREALRNAHACATLNTDGTCDGCAVSVALQQPKGGE